MVRRARTSGRSTKKSSSKRPRRRSSGGRAVTSFAVATTKTALVRSWSQVEKAPRRREARLSLPLPGAPAKPFSISSTQSATGRHRLGGLQRARQALLGGAALGARAEHARQVQAQERHAELRGGALGGERLAAALHAHEQHAARRREAEALRVRAPWPGPARRARP